MATALNCGGPPNFVVGPGKSEYGLNTYGFDPAASTAWAVINYNRDFTVGWYNQNY